MRREREGDRVCDSSFGWGETPPFTFPFVELPHSCDAWVIGGVEQIDAMIEELRKAREEILRGGGAAR